MSNPLYDIQDEIRKWLSARARLNAPDIKWISRREGRLLNDIDAGRSALSIACFVYPPIPLTVKKNVPGPQFDTMQIRITWFEDFDLNQGRGTHIDTYAIRTMQYLHHAAIPAAQAIGMQTPYAQEGEPLVWSLTKQGMEQWDCYFEARISLPCLTD